MKNNYNPYTVPENFFEDTCKEATRKYRSHRRSVRCFAGALALAAVLIVVPVFMKGTGKDASSEEVVSSNLAEMYDYDIFLQVNF